MATEPSNKFNNKNTRMEIVIAKTSIVYLPLFIGSLF